jgi:hypothetical protein
MTGNEKLRALDRAHRKEVHDAVACAVNDFAGIGYKIAGIKYDCGSLIIRCYPPEKEAISDLP